MTKCCIGVWKSPDLTTSENIVLDAFQTGTICKHIFWSLNLPVTRETVSHLDLEKISFGRNRILGEVFSWPLTTYRGFHVTVESHFLTYLVQNYPNLGQFTEDLDLRHRDKFLGKNPGDEDETLSMPILHAQGLNISTSMSSGKCFGWYILETILEV